MKRLIVLGASVALLASGVSSCKKTSKGKFSNEWKVSEHNIEQTNTDSDGDKTVWKTDVKGDEVTDVTTTISSGTSVSVTTKGTVKEYTYTIKKDGTYERVYDAYTKREDSGNTYTEDLKIKETGTWSFLSKNKTGEFKKNERVVFSLLSQEFTSVETTTIGNNSTSTTSSEKETYGEGEEISVYLVVESKKKELKLKHEDNTTGVSTTGGNTSNSSYESKETITLVKK